MSLAPVAGRGMTGSVRLVPVGADTHFGQQRHLQRRSDRAGKNALRWYVVPIHRLVEWKSTKIAVGRRGPHTDQLSIRSGHSSARQTGNGSTPFGMS